MKKVFLLLVLVLTLTVSSSSQTGPIRDLDWQQWYIMPYNYYRLTWSPPDTSTRGLLGDTLVGYNIYRDQVLYRFQTETILNYEEGGGNCTVDFLSFNGGATFYIHVTAVYNSSQQESVYNDSAYCPGLALGIPSGNIQTPHIYPNPTTGTVSINAQDIEDLYVYDQHGTTILHLQGRSGFDLGSFPKGIYLAKYTIGRQQFTEKIVLY